MNRDTMAEDLQRLRNNPRGIRFSELTRICDRHFGRPRQRGTSHRIYPTPPGVPRVNIQSLRGMAKEFQVHQVIKALEKLEGIK